MRDTLSAITGKAVRQVAKLRGGGGSALPGLIVERIDPGFMGRVLGRLPYGVVAVSGTNGKTTTTKMIVEMLEAQGLRVFTNRTGSNFSRGVVAAAIQECSATGKLDADIAVLELDEAHAMYFIDRVKPRFTLLLNVLRDQLDRFGEIDTTAKLLQRIADATTEGLVVNREDRLIAAIGERTRQRGGVEVREFGLSDALLATFPSDDDFHGGSAPAPSVDGPGTIEAAGSIEAGGTIDGAPASADVTLTEIGDHEAVFEIDGEPHRISLKLEGLYNTFNAASALATVRMILAAGPAPEHAASFGWRDGEVFPPDPSTPEILASLAEVRPAFGRGEQLELDGQPLELVLVKNPAGFRLGLASFDPAGVSVMIAINDEYADGRDMSWLWDVDFGSLAATGVDTVSGTRAWDMALRLEHDDVPWGHVEENLGRALAEFRERTMPGAEEGIGTARSPRRIYCTYTAMLELRRALAEVTEVEDIW